MPSVEFVFPKIYLDSYTAKHRHLQSKLTALGASTALTRRNLFTADITCSALSIRFVYMRPIAIEKVRVA
jgi:hypothetical protein